MRSRPRPRGIALLMALAVVMLLTFFMSELFFATGLELRGMTTFKDAEQARGLARSVFKAVQVGLMDDEVRFFEGYRELSSLLELASVPWNDGLLVQLEIAPQDHLYNLNQNYNLRQGEPADVARRNLFKATLEDVQVPARGLTRAQGVVEQPIEPTALYSLYAGIFDWIDSDGEDYIEVPGVIGGEAGAYLTHDPPVRVKDGMLDRLEELRLVRGLVESGIPWGYWEQRFTALPRVTDSTFYFTEKINVNLASQVDIRRFLEGRNVDPMEGGNPTTQAGINGYANSAKELAEFFAPLEGRREVYTPDEVGEALKSQFGFDDLYWRDHLFSTVSQYYRIRIVTEMGEVRARLDALIYVRRDPATRTGALPTIKWITLQ